MTPRIEIVTIKPVSRTGGRLLHVPTKTCEHTSFGLGDAARSTESFLEERAYSLQTRWTAANTPTSFTAQESLKHFLYQHFGLERKQEQCEWAEWSI